MAAYLSQNPNALTRVSSKLSQIKTGISKAEAELAKTYGSGQESKQSNQRMKQTIKGICELCDYQTCYNGDFNKHLLSNKHKRAVQENEVENETE